MYTNWSSQNVIFLHSLKKPVFMSSCELVSGVCIPATQSTITDQHTFVFETNAAVMSEICNQFSHKPEICDKRAIRSGQGIYPKDWFNNFLATVEIN